MVTGYLEDPNKSVWNHAVEELNEEVGIEENEIMGRYSGDVFKAEDGEVGKTWIIFPVLVEIKERVGIKTDWEHDTSKWVGIDELGNHEGLTPGLLEAFLQFS